jgi:hypothetical protein
MKTVPSGMLKPPDRESQFFVQEKSRYIRRKNEENAIVRELLESLVDRNSHFSLKCCLNRPHFSRHLRALQ